MELCGSLRRRKEVIRDIDILVSANVNDAGPIMDAFVKLPHVQNDRPGRHQGEHHRRRGRSLRRAES